MRCTPPNQRNRGFCQHKRRKRKWKGSCFACGYGRFVHGGFAGQKLSQCEFRVCTCVRHDAHTAVLLHAVKLLQERRHEFAGEIRFFFQPGEEIGQGARTFIGEGCLDGADRIFGAICAAVWMSGQSL